MTAPAPPALQLRGVARKFGGEFVLRGVDLELPQGEALALFGPNGAGKTTLLRVVAGLLGPSRGEGRILGHDLRDRRSVRELVFFLGGGGLYDDLTARENLDFSARMFGVPARSGELLGAVGLAAAERKRARELSSGMRRRLGLARLLLSPAPLLLLDEPFANLDTAGKADVLALLGGLTAPGSGRTVLFTSHEPELARAVATREATLHGGRLVLA